MENYAVVIGINKYDKFNRQLKGCVNDAEKMKEWLLKKDGGNVPPKNLFLLLSEDTYTNDEDVNKPTTIAIQNIITKMGNLSENGNADKLFLYYAGHGFCNRNHGVTENVIMPSDYDENNPNITTLEIDSIVKYCSVLRFNEQIFFFDSCRNFPSRKYFKVNYFKDPPSAYSSNPDLKQHVFYATSMGNVAKEAKLDKDTGGLFTCALLRGLKGEGNAKYYDASLGKYLVTGQRLIEFIKQEVKNSLKKDPKDIVNYNNPQLFGNPTLASFEEEDFDKVDLTIDIKPEEIASDVKINFLGGESVVVNTPHASPLPLKLLQADYGVRASFNGYQPEEKHYGIQLYSPQKLPITMRQQ